MFNSQKGHCSIQSTARTIYLLGASLAKGAGPPLPPGPLQAQVQDLFEYYPPAPLSSSPQLQALASPSPPIGDMPGLLRLLCCLEGGEGQKVLGLSSILGTQMLRRAELVIAFLLGRSDYFWVTEGVLSGSPALAWITQF